MFIEQASILFHTALRQGVGYLLSELAVGVVSTKRSNVNAIPLASLIRSWSQSTPLASYGFPD